MEDTFAPLAQMPPGLSRAIHGLPISEADLSPQEDQEPIDPALFDAWNPWTTHTVKGAVPYTSEESAEQELLHGILPIEKLARPQDFITAPEPASGQPRFQFSKKSSAPAPEDWDGPLTLEKRAGALTYTKVRDADGLVWSEGRDTNGELISYLLVLNEND